MSTLLVSANITTAQLLMNNGTGLEPIHAVAGLTIMVPSDYFSFCFHLFDAAFVCAAVYLFIWLVCFSYQGCVIK